MKSLADHSMDVVEGEGWVRFDGGRGDCGPCSDLSACTVVRVCFRQMMENRLRAKIASPAVRQRRWLVWVDPLGKVDARISVEVTHIKDIERLVRAQALRMLIAGPPELPGGGGAEGWTIHKVGLRLDGRPAVESHTIVVISAEPAPRPQP